tara:strand:- start:628 stop:2199 length:1572 start_codon:yes stop_codon:yes gene_type:complete
MLVPSSLNHDSIYEQVNNNKEKIKKNKFHKEMIIFEMANNHMGDVNHGIRILEELAKIKENYLDYFNFSIKFQFRNISTFIHNRYKGSNLKFVRRFEETALSENNWRKLLTIATKYNFNVLATPFDEKSVDRIINYKFKTIKIASCSLTDWPLLEKIAKSKKEVIFSTAGSTTEEIDSVVSFFKNRKIDFTLMYCVGKYPTSNKDLNIGALSFLKNRYPGVRIGYSTHENPNNQYAGGLALALGAKVFEKHVGLETTDYTLNDYSANPNQIICWLESLKISKLMIGNTIRRVECKREKKELRNLQRGAFVKKYIKKGEKIRSGDLQLCIPSEKNGFVANDLSKYKEYMSTKNIKQGEQISNFNCKVVDNSKKISAIVKKIKTFIKKSKVIIPNGINLEISHHYGIDKFSTFGISMFSIVNQEYCKKIIIVFPEQNHPEQYHKIKKETFHILFGELNLKVNDMRKTLKPGDVITIEPHEKHKFSSKLGCVFEEISSNHKISDSYYVDPNIKKNKDRKTFIRFWK